MMAKLDLEAVYRRVPVHPDDQLSRGRTQFTWTLPFTALKIFTALADGGA